MTGTYDLGTETGQVRLLISDTFISDPERLIFNDAEIEAFLNLAKSKVKLAAAYALETMASNEAMVSKKIQTSDGLNTDGPAVAKELRDRAAGLRKELEDEESQANYGIEILDYDPNYGRGRRRWL